jgi:hypothetical protein
MELLNNRHNLRADCFREEFYIPTKTNTYAWKYLTRRSLVLYSGAPPGRRNGRPQAAIDLSALQYGIPQ